MQHLKSQHTAFPSFSAAAATANVGFDSASFSYRFKYCVRTERSLILSFHRLSVMLLGTVVQYNLRLVCFMSSLSPRARECNSDTEFEFHEHPQPRPERDVRQFPEEKFPEAGGHVDRSDDVGNDRSFFICFNVPSSRELGSLYNLYIITSKHIYIY